jgi:hypothetical protein
MNDELEWVSKRCGALLDATEPDGQTCERWANRGGARCPAHGGSTKRALKNARARIVGDRLSAACRTYGLPADIDPGAALRGELARTNGHILWIAQRIQSLDPDDLIWGRLATTTRTGPLPESECSEEKVGERIHVWCQLYSGERAHLLKVADTMVRNGLAELNLELEQRHVDFLEVVMLGMLDDFGIDVAEPANRAIIGRRLTEASTARVGSV